MYPSTPPNGSSASVASSSPADVPPIEFLVRLSELLATSVADAGVGSIVGIRPSADGVDVAILGPTDDPGGPGESLLCFDAPDEWIALGVFSLGTARDPDHPNGYRVLIGHVQLRDGRWITILGPAEGPWDTRVGPSGPDDGSEPVGRVPDATRRALGLPTPPPATSPLVYWATLWLVALAAAPEPPTTWAEVAALFPLLDGAADPVELVDQGRLLGHGVPWSMLRRVVRRGRAPLPDITPDMAAWMDDGMFARWACEAYGPPAALLAQVDELLPVGLARRIGWVLRAWGLDGWHPGLVGASPAADPSAN